MLLGHCCWLAASLPRARTISQQGWFLMGPVAMPTKQFETITNMVASKGSITLMGWGWASFSMSAEQRSSLNSLITNISSDIL
jgi:hypothetical protein